MGAAPTVAAGDGAGNHGVPSTPSFGVWVPPVSPWPRARARYRTIEALGFDSLWVVDHFTNPFDARSPWFEAWTTLAAMAVTTRRVRIGTLVTNLIYRNPALVAKQATTVDHLSEGRLTLGIGAGSVDDPSHPMTGIDPWPAPERVDRFEEALGLIDAMMREPVTTYRGRYYGVTDAVMMPAPVQRPRPPLLVGADGPRMLRLAARHADVWSCLAGLRLSPRDALQHVREANERVTGEATAAGRDPTSIVRSMCLGWTQETPFASVEAFIDYVGRYHEAGIDEFIIGFWTPDEVPAAPPLRHVADPDLLERLAIEAIPRVRALEPATERRTPGGIRGPGGGATSS